MPMFNFAKAVFITLHPRDSAHGERVTVHAQAITLLAPIKMRGEVVGSRLEAPGLSVRVRETPSEVARLADTEHVLAYE